LLLERRSGAFSPVGDVLLGHLVLVGLLSLHDFCRSSSGWAEAAGLRYVDHEGWITGILIGNCPAPVPAAVGGSQR
jgi:hypothetical protein